MLNRIAKFLSYRLFPPLDLAATSVGFLEDEAGESNVLNISQRYRSGFYMLECRLCPELAGSLLQFSAAPPVQKLTAILSLQACRTNKRIIYLPETVDEWALCLMDTSFHPMPFTEQDCDYLRLVPLRKKFAISRMLKRLHKTGAEIKQRAQKQQQPFLIELYRLYDHSFSLSVNERYQSWIDWFEAEQVSVANRTSGSWAEDAYYFYSASGYSLENNAREVLFAELAQHPQAIIAYGDEDSVDVTGARKSPWFKPSWNPDLFIAQDYISSYYACRYDWYLKHQTVFERLGPHLALTHLLPGLPDSAIVHVPQVLAHRTLPDEVETESVDWRRGRSDVLKTILSGGICPEPGLLAGSIRMRYSMPDSVPTVSLLIPTRDGLSVLKPCVESILQRTVYPNLEILILDNQSEQAETLAWLTEIAKDQRVRVLKYDKPFNYSAINNFGARHANGSVIGLINNDVEVISPDWLIEMVSQAMRPEIGCVGAKLYYSNGQIQHSGVILGLGDVAGHAHRFAGRDDDGYHGRLKLVQNYSAVTAACLLVRREIYEAVGGLEEKYLTVAYNDVDFCIRVREAGYRNLWTPYAELYHHESISRGEDDTPAKKARYQKEVAYMQATWGEQLANDPCYNPNLCRRREDFSLPDVLF